MPSKRNSVLESDSEKEEKEKQWTDNTQSQPHAPLLHRITGGWKDASTSNHHKGKTNPFHQPPQSAK
jgi:hypothetical protein